MSYPKRLLEMPGSLSRNERAVLLAGSRAAPDPGLKDAVRASLVAVVGSALSSTAQACVAAPSPTLSGASATTALKSAGILKAMGATGVLKSLVVGALGGAMLVAGLHASQRSRAPDPRAAIAQLSTPQMAPPKPTRAIVQPEAKEQTSAHPVVESPQPFDEPVVAPAALGHSRMEGASNFWRNVETAESKAAGYPADRKGAPPAHGAPAVEAGQPTNSYLGLGTKRARPKQLAPFAREDRSAELERPARWSDQAEVQAVVRTRDFLQRGDARGALLELDRARLEFPSGILEQEREVLAVEALRASGDIATARQRARRYLASHPDSPFADAVRNLLIQ